MKRRISLKLNNKGSGIVTVLIAVVLLTLMGSLLLMLAYTGFEMKSSDRMGKQNTYDASTAMDEIKVGIQNIVSKSIETSYAYALNRYSEKGTEVQTRFAQDFIDAFEKGTVNGTRLIEQRSSVQFYRLDVIESMIVNCREGVATVTTDRDAAKVIIDRTKYKITFKDVAVSYTNKGRTTSISADINVTVPDISYSLSQFSASGVPSFSAIVGDALIQSGIDVAVTKITGGAYMKDLILENNSQIILEDGIFVCRNNVDITGDFTNIVEGEPVKSRVIVDPNSTFWTNNIIVRNTTASFLGNTYVKNDLNFVGNNATFTLSGTYTGFGTGGAEGNDARESSSIIVNGKGNTIDVQGLSNLVLSGFSFVGETPITPSVSDAANVRMGESFSVKENQKIYLVPDGYLSYITGGSDKQTVMPRTNPDIFSSDYSFVKDQEKYYIVHTENGTEIRQEVSFNTEKHLWVAEGENRSYSSYNAKLQPVCMNVSGQLIVYYFITFDKSIDGKYTAEENANRYFRDYVATNPVALNEYVNKYITVSNSKVASQTMGNFFVGGTNGLTFRDFLSNAQSAAIRTYATQYNKYFNNMCQTLSYTESSSNSNDNPFTYYINVEKIEKEIEGAQEFVVDNGETGDNRKVSALVVDGDYTYDPPVSSDIHLIIATGNVTVNKSFEGLIFCGGKLSLDSDASLTANSKEVEKAYACVATVGSENRLVGDFFKVPIGESGDKSSNSSALSAGTISTLVTYSNWKKN